MHGDGGDASSEAGQKQQRDDPQGWSLQHRTPSRLVVTSSARLGLRRPPGYSIALCEQKDPAMVRARGEMAFSVCCLAQAWGVRLTLGFGNWNRGASGVSLGSVDQVDRDREDDDDHHVQSDVEQVSLK